jgi:hypothetical protein
MGAALAYGSFAQGGFYWPHAAQLAGFLLLAVVVTAKPPVAIVPGDWLGIAGLACLTSSLLLANAFDGWPTGTRVAVATVATAAGVLILTREIVVRGMRSQLLEILSWIGATVAAVGLMGVAFHVTPWGMFATGVWRAASTLTYANALGALLVVSLPAAVLHAAERPGPSARLLTYLILAGAIASLSRGAILGLVVLAALLIRLGARDLVREMRRPFAASLVTIAGLLPSIMGDRPVPVLALLAVAAGSWIAIRPRHRDTWLDRRRTAVFVVVGALTVGGLMFSGVGSGLALSRLDPGRDWRVDGWTQAFRAASSAPVFGIGSGNLRVIRAGPLPLATAYAHNEYLQILAETGAVGLVGVAFALTLFGVWAWRRRSDFSSQRSERLVWAASIAACASFAAQSAVDLIWHFPVLVGVAFAWLALATTPPVRGGEGGWAWHRGSSVWPSL